MLTIGTASFFHLRDATKYWVSFPGLYKALRLKAGTGTAGDWLSRRRMHWGELATEYGFVGAPVRFPQFDLGVAAGGPEFVFGSPTVRLSINYCPGRGVGGMPGFPTPEVVDHHPPAGLPQIAASAASG